jgi:hypothetical protein
MNRLLNPEIKCLVLTQDKKLDFFDKFTREEREWITQKGLKPC